MRIARIIAINLLLTLIGLFLGLALIETRWTYNLHHQQAERSHRQRPSYVWETRSAGGKRISNERGLLQLILDDNVRYRTAPNQVTPFFTTDSRGFRSPEMTTRARGRRIFIVGGSAAFGTGLRSNEETVSAHLQSLLPDAEVINAATIGHRSFDEANLVSNEIDYLEPDTVVSLGGANDASYIGVELFYTSYTRQLEMRLETLHRFSHPSLLDRVANGFHSFFPVIYAKLEGGPRRLSIPKGLERPLTAEEASAGYVRNITRMHQLAKWNGYRFLCIVQLFRGDMSRDSDDGPHPVKQYRPAGKKHQNFERFRRSVVPALMEKDVPLLDLNAYAEKYPNELFMDAYHLNAEGSRRMAKDIAEKLATLSPRGEARRELTRSQ